MCVWCVYSVWCTWILPLEPAKDQQQPQQKLQVLASLDSRAIELEGEQQHNQYFVFLSALQVQIENSSKMEL